MKVADYDKKGRHTLRDVAVDYLGGRYQGRGVLAWDPDEGFQIEAPMERFGPPLPDEIEFGRPRIVQQSDWRAIRMRLGRSRYAVTPKLLLGDRLDLLLSEHLRVHVDRVVFMERTKRFRHSNRWSGAALFEHAGTIVLPEPLQRDSRVVDRVVLTEWRKAVMEHEDQDQEIRCWKPDDKTIRLEWSFVQGKWPFHYAWGWAIGAELALSMMTGQTVRLLEREGCRGNHTYREVWKRRPVHGLRFLKPLSLDELDKDVFVKLAHFFCRQDTAGNVSNRIFEQLTAASRQESFQAQELLCATILEAALRTLESRPMEPGSGRDNYVPGALKRFREKYWPREWKKTYKRALQVRRNLRDRNAHPDWLVGSGTGRPREAIGQALDQLIFMSHFYGHMVLALAGFKTNPVFPAPHREWAPIMTHSRDAEPSEGVESPDGPSAQGSRAEQP